MLLLNLLKLSIYLPFSKTMCLFSTQIIVLTGNSGQFLSALKDMFLAIKWRWYIDSDKRQ